MSYSAFLLPFMPYRPCNKEILLQFPNAPPPHKCLFNTVQSQRQPQSHNRGFFQLKHLFKVKTQERSLKLQISYSRSTYGSAQLLFMYDNQLIEMTGN